VKNVLIRFSANTNFTNFFKCMGYFRKNNFSLSMLLFLKIGGMIDSNIITLKRIGSITFYFR
ncbi:MAG TPA: hypothetical protein PLC00_06010, partial [Bacteroidales bacterium]|nr:hypothetical protein [Bacteroidales bacterium]